MANYRGRKLTYKPRMTDDEAYELLNPNLRRALQDSVNNWSAYACLRHSRKHGWGATVKWLRDADEFFIKKGWEPARGKTKAVPSPSVSARVKPLRANWCQA